VDSSQKPTNQPTSWLKSSETCEEVHGMIGDVYLRCGEPAITIVYHNRPGEQPYRMCLAHASHNIRNRNATELVPR
jgi:hypothetical protein